MGRLERKNREFHNRKEKNIILIGAEGDNITESIYFLSISRHFRKYQIKIADGNKTDPVGIVEDVIKSIKKAGIDINNAILQHVFLIRILEKQRRNKLMMPENWQVNMAF